MAGVVGVVSLVLAGAASARTDGPAADTPSRAAAPSQEITLSEEEIADVSLATFNTLDHENAAIYLRLKVAHCRGCGCGSCSSCRGCGSCRGCSCRGCRY
jgi:hypothetical protein